MLAHQFHQRLCLFLLLQLCVVFLAACVGGGTTTHPPQDTTPPAVAQTSPPDGSQDVTGLSSITVTFTKAVAPATLTPATFLLTDSANTPVAGAVTASDTSAVFTPDAPLTPGTTYTAILTHDVTDVTGHAIPVGYVWSFTTGTKPTVAQASPPDTSQGVIGPSSTAVTVSKAEVPATLPPVMPTPKETANAPVAVAVALPAITATTPPSVSRQPGPPNADLGQATATDATGNVYLAGYTNGNFAGQVNAGLLDLYVVKYDPQGTMLWTRQLGTPNSDVAQAVATDATGNVYVTGYTYGSLDGHPNAGQSDLFVVKLDPQGTTLWTRQSGTPSLDHAYGVAIDPGGSVYVTGYTDGSLDGHPNAGQSDLFVVKLDPQGATLWTRQFGTPSSDVAQAVATDATGNVYVTGYTYGSLDGHPNAGQSDLFVVKLDPQGTTLWTRQFGTPSFDHAYGVAIDSSRNVYLAGSTYGSLDGHPNAGQSDLFVVKLDPQGATLWTRQFGTPSSDVAQAVATDATGSVYAAGYTNDGLDSNTRTGLSDLFVVKFDPQGTKLWTRQWGTPSFDHACGVVTDPSGNVYVGGSASGNLDSYTKTGLPDFFLVKYDSQGAKLLTSQLRAPGS